MEVKLLNVRTAFLDLFEAKSIGGGQPRFGATAIIVPNSDNAKALANAVTEVAREKWKEKAPAVLQLLLQGDKVCYRRAPKLNQDGLIYEGFEGMHWVSGANKKMPKIKAGDGKTTLTTDTGLFYSGCRAHLVLDIWAQDDKDYGRRINATLSGIMFAGDDDAFGGGRVASDDAFDEMPTVAPAEGDDPLAGMM